MAELQPQEGLETTGAATATTVTITAAAIVPAADNNNHHQQQLGPSLAPKRQRRPSVRLGEIGDLDSRRPKSWRFHRDPSLAAKSSKTRPLTNLVIDNGGDNFLESVDTINDDLHSNIDFGGRRPPKSKKPTKRVRANWTTASKVDNGVEGDVIIREENNTNNNDNDEEEFRELEPDGSESPLKEQSPVHSVDNAAIESWQGHRRTIRARVSETRDRNHDDELPESNFRDRKCETSGDGVRDWLIGLGLGRYAPVFEIHEVDDEVLPMLTLEDLKDMGINAVGSRRKMYTAILKLRKGFS